LIIDEEESLSHKPGKEQGDGNQEKEVINELSVFEEQSVK